MCSDTLNPGGEVRGCSVGCILGMPEISPSVFIAAASMYMGFLEVKKCFSSVGVLGTADFSGVLIGTKSIFVSAQVYVSLKVMPHTTAAAL